MIIRTYLCEDDHEFTTGERDPECPRCGSTTLQWVPRAGHGGILKVLYTSERIARQQADDYGLTNINKPEFGKASRPRDTAPTRSLGQYSAGGMTSELACDASGNPVIECKPTGMTTKVSPKVGGAHAGTLPPTNIVARYNGR